MDSHCERNSSSTSGVQTGRFGSQHGEEDALDDDEHKELTEVEEGAGVKEAGDEDYMSQTVDFEVVRSKLENISRTS